MNLSEYDGLCVQREYTVGEVFEGVCCYHSAEYCVKDGSCLQHLKIIANKEETR